MDNKVYINHCEDYDVSKLTDIISDAFDKLGIGTDTIKDKNVLIKANLVMAKKPEFAATTHPATVEACANVLKKLGAKSVIAADSPGGPYNAQALALVYRTCGFDKLKNSDNIALNDNFSFTSVSYPQGKVLKNFNVTDTVLNADVVIDLCKLKSHGLTGMSCAVKNFFGIIPGTEKVQMHANFPKIEDFSEMLVDLCSYVTSTKTVIAICDAVLSMEGNGPTHGIAKKTELMLVSKNPYALDVVGEHIMSKDGEIKHVDVAAERGYTSRRFEDIELVGMTDCPVYDFVSPDSDSGKLLKALPDMFGGRLRKYLEARPEINKAKCVGCGVCVRSCPQNTITIKKSGKKKQAKINDSNCIKCYCCQELCPIGAVKTRQSMIIKLIH